MGTEAFEGDSPESGQSSKSGESSRLSPDSEDGFKLSPKLGESFRGDFVQQERTVTHFHSNSKLPPKTGKRFQTLT